MKSRIKISFLTAALACLTLPVVAQSTTPPTGNTIKDRQENQQDRIKQGVKSGELTPQEARRLEKNHQRINNEIRQDRAANGGKLTPQEKRQITKQQNRESRAIYKQKHDGQTR